jgi:hypothetical protein
VVEDFLFADLVADKLVPDDIPMLGISLIHDYRSVLNAQMDARPKWLEVSPCDQGLQILDCWIKNHPDDTAECLMEAVTSLKVASLTKNVRNLLTKIAVQAANESSQAVGAESRVESMASL